MQIAFEKLRTMDSVSREAYKALRTNITFCGEDIKAIAITSSMPNEENLRWRFLLHRHLRKITSRSF